MFNYSYPIRCYNQLDCITVKYTFCCANTNKYPKLNCPIVRNSSTRLLRDVPLHLIRVAEYNHIILYIKLKCRKGLTFTVNRYCREAKNNDTGNNKNDDFI